MSWWIIVQIKHNINSQILKNSILQNNYGLKPNIHETQI